MPSPKRAALYVRVSTDRQHTENQKPECEQLARQRGFDIVEVYEEQASAKKRRPEYERMMRDAKRGAFDVLVFWALDRYTRDRLVGPQDIAELDRVGVQTVSVRETWVDTSGPHRDLLIQFFSWMAEQEHRRLVERIQAGLERVRQEEADPRKRAARRNRSKKDGGPKLAIGRPRTLDDAGVAKVRELRAAGRSWSEIAKAVGCSPWAARRAVMAAKEAA